MTFLRVDYGEEVKLTLAALAVFELALIYP
jgi:hypothetical protein